METNTIAQKNHLLLWDWELMGTKHEFEVHNCTFLETVFTTEPFISHVVS